MPFPLEVYGGGPANRQVHEQEIWLAALQEPRAEFRPFQGNDWPATTLPAFEAAWCAEQQGDEVGRAYDLRVRRAFFAESRNIGKRDVLVEIAREIGLDMPHFMQMFDSDEPRKQVLELGRRGKEEFRVRGTPTLMLPDGTRLKHPIAYPSMENDKIVKVGILPCCGEGCLEATRGLFERALEWEGQASK